MPKFSIRAVFLVPTILLTACAHGPADLNPQPSLDQMATDRAVERVTAVDVTQQCRRLTKRDPLPQDYEGKDAYLSRRQWKAAAEVRDVQLAKVDTCIADTHAAYAKGLPTK